MTRPLRPDDELNVVRAAVRHGRHPGTVDRAIRSGEIPFRWEDGRRLVRVADIDSWAARTDRGRTAVPRVAEPKPRTATAGSART